MKSDDEIKRAFLDLPKEKQKRLHGVMAELFTRLEAEWRANPENQGKPFSYAKLWEDFVAGDTGKSDNGGQVDGGPP